MELPQTVIDAILIDKDWEKVVKAVEAAFPIVNCMTTHQVILDMGKHIPRYKNVGEAKKALTGRAWGGIHSYDQGKWYQKKVWDVVQLADNEPTSSVVLKLKELHSLVYDKGGILDKASEIWLANNKG